MQDCVVYRRDDEFAVRGSIDGAELATSRSAAGAIQFAVDWLGTDGGEVRLARGAYPLERAVRLSDATCLRGSGRGTKLRVRADNADGVGVLLDHAKGASVADLAVLGQDGAAAGVVLDASGDCQVERVFCAGFRDHGIWVRNNSFLCAVKGCSLAGNGKSNIYLDHLREGEYGDYVPNLVADSIVYGGGKGIECDDAIVVNIVGCAVYQTAGYAYHIHSFSNSVVVSGCRSFQISSDCVVVEGTHELNLTGNIFCWHTGHGVVVRDSYWGAITGNNIIDTGSYNGGTDNHETLKADTPNPPLMNGVELRHARGYTLTGNTVFNWSVAPKMRCGILEDAESYNNTITGNNINYYTDAAVVAHGRDTVTANNVGYADLAYNDPQDLKPYYQSFQRELTERFIREQM